MDVKEIDDSGDYIIDFIVPFQSQTKLSVYDATGKEFHTILDLELVNPGFYQKVLPGDKVNGYQPVVILKTEKHQAKKQIELSQKL